MMFRYGKIIESNNRSTRSDRFAEMSKQQQLIESKKQEIKARFEKRKRQEVVETLMESEPKVNPEPKLSKDMKSLRTNRLQSWKRTNTDNDSKHASTRHDRWKKKQSDHEDSQSSHKSNLFSNDGSFLEKFKQMTETKNTNVECKTRPDIGYLSSQYEVQRPEKRPREEEHYHSDASRMPPTGSEGIPYPPPNVNVIPTTSNPQQQSLYPITSHPPPPVPSVSSNIHTSLATVPASVPVLSEVPSSGTSLQTVSLIQVPVSVPASSVILSCPLQTTLVSSEPVVHLPVVQTSLSHSSVSVPIQTVPIQTTVIPAQIQITSQAGVPQSTVQTVQINQSSANVILSQTIQPQSILVSSECIQHSAPSAPPPTSLPNTNVPPPLILNPPPPQTPLPQMYSSVASLPSAVYNMPPAVSPDTPTLPPVHIPPPNFNPMASRNSLRPDPPNNINFATCGRGEICSERTLNTSELDTHPMIQLNNQHEVGRDDIGRFDGTVNRLGIDCGRSTDNQSLFRERSGCDNMTYIPDRKSSNTSNNTFQSSSDRSRKEKAFENRDFNESNSKYQNKSSLRCSTVNEDDSDSAETNDRIKRKRKRKSRWAPEDSKVDLSSATPTLGTVPIIPVSTPASTSKLPGLSGPLISQVKKHDPALMQYTMKAFGTIDLSEEEWKKAEDSYKINLLYQDMMKKRQELERLRAAGKFKYEYDSDEETEGGTWEHKLRNQEMFATQKWADELTEQAKGKHHIGDFLPPDELDRFMEKYDAMKKGREPDLSDYKEFKLKEDNIGFQMLQKLGWTEGQGLGADGSGIVNPVNKASASSLSHGLGIEKPDEVRRNDDEYDAYRKRMMLAYRFRPNPLNNPRRPYY